MLIEKINITPNAKSNYPYNLALFAKEISLDVNRSVTIFVGENGCGKSTLLKLIQSKLSLVEIKLPGAEIKDKINSEDIDIFPKHGKIRGLFFESLTFINYIEYVQREIADSTAELKRIDIEYQNKSDYARNMAKTPHARTIMELKRMYDKDLSKSSHGESYLDFFASRIKDNQIYLLDEPETPLSVQNQLTLMAMILEATNRGCQFIIATHSPVLTAIPEALVYEIQADEFIQTKYEEIKSIQLLKQFLNNKEQFLRYFE